MVWSTMFVLRHHSLCSFRWWIAFFAAVVVNVEVYHMVGSWIPTDYISFGVYFHSVRLHSRHTGRRYDWWYSPLYPGVDWSKRHTWWLCRHSLYLNIVCAIEPRQRRVVSFCSIVAIDTSFYLWTNVVTVAEVVLVPYSRLRGILICSVIKRCWMERVPDMKSVVLVMPKPTTNRKYSFRHT